MEAVLDAQGIWDAVKPTAGEVVDVKKEKAARAFLFQSIPEHVLLQVANKKTAKEVWDCIEIRHVGADRVKQARLHTLKSEFEKLEMKDGESIDDFAGKLSGMASRFASVGGTLANVDLVKKLLYCVPDSFFTVVAGIEQFQDVETMLFEEAIGRLKAWEERSRLRGDRSSSTGQLLFTQAEGQARKKNKGKQMLTKEEWIAWHKARKAKGKETDDEDSSSDSDRDSKKGSRGHKKEKGKSIEDNNSSRQGKKDKSRIKCYRCGKMGHYASECRTPLKEEDKEDEANLIGLEDDSCLM